MELRNLYKTSIVSSGGGQSAGYRPRETGIFWASGGAADDFDHVKYDSDNTVTEGPEINIGLHYYYHYLYKKTSALKKVYAFFCYNGNYTDYKSIPTIGFDIGGRYIDVYMRYGSLNCKVRDNAKGEYYIDRPNSSNSDEALNQNYIDFPTTLSKSSVIEVCCDLEEKKVTFYFGGKDFILNIPDDVEGGTIKGVVWCAPYSTDLSRLSELALSTKRIGRVAIKPIVAVAKGDINDFGDENEGYILNNYAYNSKPVRGGHTGATQLYAMSEADLYEGTKVTLVLNNNVAHNTVESIANVMKMAEGEYEDGLFVPDVIKGVTTSVYEVNPITGKNWTKDDLSKIQSGVRVKGVEV